MKLPATRPECMRAIVTGATGLLGRTITSQLIQGGRSVTALVRDASNRSVLVGAGVTFHVCDSSNTIGPEVLRGADAVFHTAAAVSDWGPWSYFQANTIEATRSLCAAMKA